MTLFTASVTSFKSLSKFTSLKDFNDNIEMWLADHKSKFTPTELIAFKRLARHAVKVPGLANASLKKLVMASQQKDDNGTGIGGVSRSTMQRAIKKAVQLGIVIIKDTIRQNKSQSTNLYIFQRYQSDLNCPTIEQGGENKKTSQSAPRKRRIVIQLNTLKATKIFKSNIIKNIYTYNTQYHENNAVKEKNTKQKDSSKILRNQNTLFTRVKDLLTQFNMQHDINEFSKIIFGSIKKYSGQLDHGLLEHVTYKAIIDVMKTPDSHVKNNRFAMLSGFIKRNINTILNANKPKPSNEPKMRSKVKTGIEWLDNGDHRKKKVVITEDKKDYYAKKQAEILAKLNR